MDRVKMLWVMLFAISLFLFTAVPSGYCLGHYGIPGTTEGCNICHDFVNGDFNGGTPTVPNLRWVKSSIEWPTGTTHTGVTFTSFDTTPGTLADGDDLNLDGPCEVCHTATTYHNNSGDGTTHFDGVDCTACHPHFTDDITNYFEPRFVGGQSHTTHFTDPKGPQFGADPDCHLCHSTSNFHLFADGNPLVPEPPTYPNGTNVCDSCHSPDGAFDGVADAKAKWEDAVYEENGQDLKPGNENWCAGCHDDGTSVVNGVSAPNIMGDNTSYGYNVTGHGKDSLNYVYCEDCHDLSVAHTDGDARTYSVAADNYVAAYRLAGDMTIPRVGGTLIETSFRLCFDNCHIFSRIFGADTTNFRDTTRGLQYHDLHLSSTAGFETWDSDWDGAPDTGLSCPACHNVHGSPTVVMTRHGELISTPGTTDKVPALNFRWYKQDGTTQTTDLLESRWGALQGGDYGGTTVNANHVCTFCHPTGEITYYRAPVGTTRIKILNVWTSNLSDTPKTNFNVGANIRYHVSFEIVGSASDTFFVRSPKNNSKAFATSGTDWETPLGKSKEDLAPGVYEWKWDKTIPTEATSPSTAQVKIRLKLFDTKGGTLLDRRLKKSTFSIN